MANLTIDGLGELQAPDDGDFVGIWDVSAGQFLKVHRSLLVGATITGGGTIALGGKTLTVSDTGTAALLAHGTWEPTLTCGGSGTITLNSDYDTAYYVKLVISCTFRVRSAYRVFHLRWERSCLGICHLRLPT